MSGLEEMVAEVLTKVILDMWMDEVGSESCVVAVAVFPVPSPRGSSEKSGSPGAFPASRVMVLREAATCQAFGWSLAPQGTCQSHGSFEHGRHTEDRWGA